MCIRDRGKHAVTHYRVLERLGYVTLVECVLETGRTHQIRVHLSLIHIFDVLFGNGIVSVNHIIHNAFVFNGYDDTTSNHRLRLRLKAAAARRPFHVFLISSSFPARCSGRFGEVMVSV